ncbi:Ell-associated factor Eaf [Trichinella spiralis]
MGVWEDEAARATLPSMLILGVTESFGINASILNNMNNTRPRCVIVMSNMVTVSARSQRTADSTTDTSY